MNDSIETEIQNLKDRNTRVEIDKAWERSPTRRTFIIVVTYSVAALWLYFINENNILLKAFVPTGGYLLSTLSIPQLKKIWLKLKKSA
jgi:hypothetical protein